MEGDSTIGNERLMIIISTSKITVETQLLRNEINVLVTESKLSKDFINKHVFPVVLSDLIEEHEDAKFNLILNGFANVFIDEHTDESIILTHFDTLRGLRYMDVRRLFQVTKVQTDESIRFPLHYNEAITKRIDDKLESMGLITA